MGKLGTSRGMGAVGEKGDPARIQGGLGETSCLRGRRGSRPGSGVLLRWVTTVWLSVATQSVCGWIRTGNRIRSWWGIGSLVKKLEMVDGIGQVDHSIVVDVCSIETRRHGAATGQPQL